MTNAPPISVEEYLASAYSPDCDYIDGDVLERAFGERDHSAAQREILFWLGQNYPEDRRSILPEQRVQVGKTRFRVPDICVLAPEAPVEAVVTTPPFLCIEILSPEDRMGRVMDRVHDYAAMGVRWC